MTLALLKKIEHFINDDPGTVLIRVIGRALAGFVAGFILVYFALVLVGYAPGHPDLSQPELDREHRSWRIAGYSACAVAALAMLAGRIRVPRFLGILVIVFGAMSVMLGYLLSAVAKSPMFSAGYANALEQIAQILLLPLLVVVAILIARWIDRRMARQRCESNAPAGGAE